jgi:hypothetical protein
MYINSAGGGDIVNVGKGSASGGARNVLGDIDIQNAPSFTTVNIDDASDTVPRAVSSGTLGGVGNPFGYVAGLAAGTVYYKYSEVSGINVGLGGSFAGGGDSVNIYETFRPIAFTNTNGGQTSILVGNNTNGTGAILGDLRLLAFGFAANDVIIDNNNGLARTATLAKFVAGEYRLSGFTGGGFITYNRQAFNSGETFTVRGGNSAESLSVNNVDDTYVSFDGRGGLDSLTVDDRAQVTPPTSATVSQTAITRAGAAVYTVNYANIDSFGYLAHNSATTTTITGTPPTIPAGQQTTLQLGNNADTVTVYPHDAAGNLTINSNLGIIGNGGSDFMRVQDSASSNPINYSFSNPFGSGTQNLFGVGLGGIGTATIETWEVTAATAPTPSP